MNLNEIFLTPALMANILTKNKFKLFKHTLEIDSIIANNIYGNNKYTIISMPPRHGKSHLVSEWLPFWFLNKYPDKNVILTSYEAKFAGSWGKKVRDKFSIYKEYCNVEVDQSSHAVNSFRIKSHYGGMETAGAGGAITGKGADLLIVDDPIKNDAEANSETYRENIWEWFVSTVVTRIETGGSCIIIMTRWHADDIVGRLIEQDNKFQYHCFPALDFTENGEIKALWPEKYNVEWLLNQQQLMGKFWFQSLYQQTPYAPEGTIFNVDSFNYFEYNWEKFPYVKMYATVDLALSLSESADYTCVLVFFIEKEKLYIVDVIRKRNTPLQNVDLLKELHKKYRFTMIGIEQVQYQSLFIDMLNEAGLPTAPLTPDKDKLTRSLTISAFLDMNSCYINQSEWNSAFLSELIQFPKAKHDDMIDCFSYIPYLCKINGSQTFLPYGIQIPKKRLSSGY